MTYTAKQLRELVSALPGSVADIVREYADLLDWKARIEEAQGKGSEAPDVVRRLRYGCGYCKTDPVRRVAAALLESLSARLAELEARLEIDPRTKYDGIATRDETIRQLERKLAEARKEAERLRNALTPRCWTHEQSAAWHRSIPDVHAAFAALLAAAMKEGK